MIEQKTLAEIVIENPSAAKLFEEVHLDFCCKGKRTLEAACKEAKLDVGTIRYELEERDYLKKSEAIDHNFNTMELDILVDYIIKKHHAYVIENMPMILSHLRKVAFKHGEKHPETIQIALKFEEVSNELESHMRKEELILFPYINKLVRVKNNYETTAFVNSFIENPIKVMEHEHETVGNLMFDILKLSNDFTPPSNACTTYKLSYNELREFLEDLHQHIHLENNILFPKAATLEDELIAGLIVSTVAGV